MPVLSPIQRWSINRATRRLNIWHGSVRASKTVATIWAWLMYVPIAPPGELLMVGKTLGSLKRNIINPILDLVGNAGKYYSGKQEFHLFGRIIHTVGASDERSEGKIRGGTFAGCLGDELTLWPESFFIMMLSRLSLEGSKFFGTTNPDNPNHWLKKKYINRKNELNMALFHFTLDDNPFLSKQYVQDLKNEYTGLWYKRFIEGKWCVAEGAIYDFFDEKIHVIKRLPEAVYYTASFDYGTSVPFVFTVFGHNPTVTPDVGPKVWSEREFYYDPKTRKRQQTDAQFSKDVLKIIKPIKPKLRAIYGDPSAESFHLQLKGDDGSLNIQDADNDVLNGIRTVSRMLHSGEYMMGVNCVMTIAEKSSYMWDPKKQMVGIDEPLKVDDHCSDTERYDLHTQFGVGKYDINNFMKD